jgi:hypothetical protein
MALIEGMLQELEDEAWSTRASPATRPVPSS